MTSENTFFNRGVEIGSAPMEGMDANTARDALAVRNDDAHQASFQSTRNATQVNDENAYQKDRQHGWDAENKAAAAGMPMKSAAALRAAAKNAGGPSGAAPAAGMAPPTGAQAIDQAATAPAAGMAAPGAAAPAAPAAPAPSEGDEYRRQAAQLVTQGKFEAAEVLKGRATAADIKDSFEKGATMAEQPGVFEAAARLITQKDKALTFSTDSHGRQLLSIAQPNGAASTVVIDDAKRKIILGAQQMMEDGFVEAALGKLAGVSADLAAEMASRNKQVAGVADQRNKVMHEEQDDDAKTTAANASMVSAKAHAAQVAQAGKKESYGSPVQLLDDKGNAYLAQPVRTNGKVSFEKVELPEGSRFPKQAADRKFNEKSGVFTDSATGKPLSRLDPESGMILPVGEKDEFAGKDGAKKQAEYEDQGVLRGVVEDDKGVAHYAWVSKDDPTQAKYSTAKEAIAAGKKSASAAIKPRPDSGPAAPRQAPTDGRGLDFIRSNLSQGKPIFPYSEAEEATAAENVRKRNAAQGQ